MAKLTKAQQQRRSALVCTLALMSRDGWVHYSPDSYQPLERELRELDAQAALSEEHYFALAARWAATLSADDPRRFSTVVTRPNSPESRAFLDAFAAKAKREARKTRKA